MIFTRNGAIFTRTQTQSHIPCLSDVTTLDTSHDLVSAPAHALPRASSGLNRRARRRAHPTASWLLQRPAARLLLAPRPRREARVGHLVREEQLEVQLGLLRREHLNGVEAGLPLAEKS